MVRRRFAKPVSARISGFNSQSRRPIKMKNKTTLIVILVISIAGLLFSGYLSFSEIFSGKCPVGGCSSIFGIPVCLIGFVMYLIVFIFSLIGLSSRK